MHRLIRSVLSISFVGGWLVAGGSSDAGDLFRVTVTDGVTTLSSSGSSLFDLASEAIKTSDRFEQFSGSDVTATIDYAGVRNALTFTVNAAGTSATLTIPSTGFSRTFTGQDSEDLKDQIIQFAKRDASREWTRFLAVINEQTLVGVTDGNPMSATALLAGGSFDRFAFHANPWRGENEGGLVLAAEPMLGHAEAGGIQVNAASLPLTLGLQFGSRVATLLTVTPAYRWVEGADVFHVGMELGIPVRLLIASAHWPVSWQVTPFGVGDISGSLALAAGGIVAGG